MAQAKIITKSKNKNWYLILAPKIFRNIELGETLVYEPKDMIGKRLTQSLASLTRDIKKQNIKIEFLVTSVADNKASTAIIGYKMVPASIKRLVRRRGEKIDISFAAETLDKKRLRIKPLIITRSITKGSINAKIYKITVDFLSKNIKKLTFDNFVNDLINQKIQNSLRDELKRIYPLRTCEIRHMHLEEEKGKEPEAKGKEAFSEEIEETKETETMKKPETREKKEKKVKGRIQAKEEAETEQRKEIKEKKEAKEEIVEEVIEE